MPLDRPRDQHQVPSHGRAMLQHAITMSGTMSSQVLRFALLLFTPIVAWAAETFAVDIAAGKFDEHCLKIDAGRSIRYKFVAGAPVDFNIHHHRGKEVLYPVRRDGIERDEGEFRAPNTDDYCLMWTNTGRAQVRVTGKVTR